MIGKRKGNRIERRNGGGRDSGLGGVGEGDLLTTAGENNFKRISTGLQKHADIRIYKD